MDPRQTAETFNTLQPLVFWLVAGLTGLCAIATVVTQNIVRAATWLLFTLAGTSAIFFLLGADLVGATQLLVYVGGTLVLVVFGVMLTAQGPFISMKTSGAEWAISVIAGLLLLGVLTTGISSERVVKLTPKVKTTVIDPETGAKHYRYVSPAVAKYAPKHSRAEALALAGRPAMPVQSGPGGPPPMGGPPMGGPPMGGPPMGGPPMGKGGMKGMGEPGKGGPPGAMKGGPPMAMPKGMGGPPAAPPEPPEPAPAVDAASSAQSVTLGQGFLGVGLGPAHTDGDRHIVRTSYLLPFEIVSVHLLVVLIGAAYLARAKRRRGVVS